jgi:hypothetical protein
VFSTLLRRCPSPIGDRNMRISFNRYVTRNRHPIMRNQVRVYTVVEFFSPIDRVGGRLADLPPPPPSMNPDYVQCPYCGRNYAPNVAERHIPKCVNIQNKPRPPPPPGPSRMPNQQRGGAAASNTRTPIASYSSSSGGFRNSNETHPPPNRGHRGGRY